MKRKLSERKSRISVMGRKTHAEGDPGEYNGAIKKKKKKAPNPTNARKLYRVPSKRKSWSLSLNRGEKTRGMSVLRQEKRNDKKRATGGRDTEKKFNHTEATD